MVMPTGSAREIGVMDLCIEPEISGHNSSAGVLDVIVSSSSTPDIKLNNFKMLILVDERVRLFGANLRRG
jgi:hypothetical protein